MVIIAENNGIAPIKTLWLADMYIPTLLMDIKNPDYSIHSISQKVGQ